jgi:lysophospholipase
MAILGTTLSTIGLGGLPTGRAQDGLPSERNFPGNPVTSDLVRYMRTVDTWRERPDLIVGQPTIRWGAAAMRAWTSAMIASSLCRPGRGRARISSARRSGSRAMALAGE